MDEVQPGGSVMTAAPPPMEVKIRTMKSDIESMIASGGGLPRFSNVKVAGLAKQQESSTSIARTESKSNLVLIVVLVIAVIALAVVGWLVYMKFAG